MARSTLPKKSVDAAINSAVAERSESLETGIIPDSLKDEPIEGSFRELPDDETITPLASNFRELPENEVITPIEPESVQQEPPIETPTEPKEGPLGIVPKEVRGDVRETIEGQNGILQFLYEASPSIAGAVGGAALGVGFGPPGIIAGGIIGGLTGEVVAQESGLAPSSDVNLALSAAGPLVGPVAGGVFKGVKRGFGLISTNLPFAKAARSKNTIGKVVEEFESVGTNILAKQKGLLARPASDLYAAVRRSGVVVSGKALDKTRGAIDELLEELHVLRAFPEVKVAIQHLRNVNNTIAPGKPSAILGVDGKAIAVSNEISIDNIVALRQQVGRAVKAAERAEGVKLGSAKKLFKSLNDDLDAIANNPGLGARGARLAQSAVKRARLEFSVKDFESAVAKFTKDTVGHGGTPETAINLKGLQKWLRDVTNPRHDGFKKNFTNALKDDLPAITKRLEDLAKIVTKGGPGGPGSLIIRGKFARAGAALLGGLAGGVGLGPGGALLGAVIGAQGPEMLVSVLTTKTGAAFLEASAKAGGGAINMKSWIAAGEVATRSLGDKNEKDARKREAKKKEQNK